MNKALWFRNIFPVILFVTILFTGCTKTDFTLNIDSSPQGAAVYLKETKLGETPIATEYKAIKELIEWETPIKLKLTLEQYNAFETDLTFRKGTDINQTYTLERFAGLLPGYNGIYARNKKLTLADILEKNSEELGYMRNEIFARYGRIFETPKYEEYFKKESWYYENPAYSDKLLNDTDRENIALILTLEEPKMTPPEMISLVLKNIEYATDYSTITFLSPSTMQLLNDQILEQLSAYYPEDPPIAYWVPKGDWVLVKAVNYYDSDNYEAYLLDHKNKKAVKRMDLPIEMGEMAFRGVDMGN